MLWSQSALGWASLGALPCWALPACLQVPDSVKVHSGSVLQGFWDPYPITMEFFPPCMTRSLIGLKGPGQVLKVRIETRSLDLAPY